MRLSPSCGLAALALLVAALGCSAGKRAGADGSDAVGGSGSPGARAAQAAWRTVRSRMAEWLPDLRRLDQAVRAAAATEEVDFARLGRMLDACNTARARLSIPAGLGDGVEPPRVLEPVRRFEEEAAAFARVTAPCAAGAALPCAQACVDAWEGLAGAYAALVDAATADDVAVEGLGGEDAS